MVSLAACALCASLAVASSPSPSPSPSPVPQIAHVFTSDRVDETLKNAARTTYVVTHDQIERNGYRTVADALQAIPAVQILPYGAFGSNTNYGIRGSDSAQVLVLVDGLPAPGSFANSVELGNLPTTGVDRIEVVEGGGSTLYGTGAVGGIINVITQRSSATDARVRYGSFADRELTVDTPNVQVSRVMMRNDFALPGGGTQPDSDYASWAVHAGGERKAGAFDVALRANLESDKGGTPGLIPYQSTTSREGDVNEDGSIALTHRTAQSESVIQLGAARQLITFACIDNPAVDPDCYQSAPSLDRDERLSFSARNAVASANGQVLYGIDLSRGTVRSDTGDTFFVNALAQTGAYVQVHANVRRGSFYYGLRGERDGALGGEFSPSAGGIYRISDALSARANIATAFRAPNATELYYPGYGYAGLRPERAKVADFTLTDNAIAGGVSVGWFGNRTNDLIVPVLLDPATFTYGPRNVDHTLIEGLTLDARTLPLHGFTAALNVTDLYRAQDLDAQTRLPNQAVFTANLRLDYTAPRESVLDGYGVSLHMAGQRGYVDATQPLFDQPAAFTTLNAYLRLRAGQHLLLSLRGYNLGNERYAALGGFGNAINGYPMPGRSFALEVSAR